MQQCTCHKLCRVCFCNLNGETFFEGGSAWSLESCDVEGSAWLVKSCGSGRTVLRLLWVGVHLRPAEVGFLYLSEDKGVNTRNAVSVAQGPICSI